MATHRMPQQEQHGRFGSVLERILLLMLLTLAIVIVGFLAQQIREALEPPPLPTLVPTVTAVNVAVDPVMQIAPAAGVPGTLITVQGEGWQAGDRLIVCLDDLGDDGEPPILAETIVSEAGKFTAVFTFPTDVQWLSLPDIPVMVASTTTQDKQSALFRLVEKTPTPVPATVVPATPTIMPSATSVCHYSMRFVADVTIPDDTAVPAGAGFVKTWRIQNNGNCVWPAGTSWVFIGGSQMGGPDAVPVAGTAPGETADVTVHLVAPTMPGQYIGYWTLRLANGERLDQRYFVRIVVPVPTATNTPVTPTPTVAPATATPVIFNWRGEYYSNPMLTGAPSLVRDDTAVDFNWYSAAPATELPADEFSVRWQRSLYFAGGSYRFYAAADDGLRLWIDNVLILDEWHSATGKTYTTEITLTSGNHVVRVEYYEASGLAFIQLWWRHIESYPDWRGEYWDNKNLSGTPVLVRNDSAIAFNWQDGAPALGLPVDQFSARWTQKITFEPGSYRFYARADDGVRVYVDGEKVIDQWHLSGGDHVYQTEVELAGEHTIIVEYYDEHIAAQVHFWYEQLPVPDE